MATEYHGQKPHALCEQTETCWALIVVPVMLEGFTLDTSDNFTGSKRISLLFPFAAETRERHFIETQIA